MNITLYNSGVRPWGTPDLSPFCIKLECYLRMAGHVYEAKSADIQKAPKGKVPYVNIDGERMGDSQLIIERLESLSASPLDSHLSDTDRALAHCVRRAFEEGLYFIGMYFRWFDDAGYAVLKPEFSRILPKPLRPIIMPIIRRRVRQMLFAQGTGRHTSDEISKLGARDVNAISQLLGDHAFFFGQKPSTLDATLYGFLEALLGFPSPAPLRAHALDCSNLVKYRNRIRAQYFPELPSLL